MKKQNLAIGKIGMEKDSHPSGLNENQYPFAKNMNLENEIGNSLNASSEHSNILASKFKEGFKVIHAVNDIDTTNTYFFLVNPVTGVGEFGIIENNQNITELQDTVIDCGDCHSIKQLAQPLETLTQVASQTYTTLISDACHVTAGHPEKGFMFNILNPIKKSVIKNEKCGKTIYFSQKGNPPRHINIDKIQDYFIQEVPCSADVILTCPNFDKMRIFKLFNIPEIEPASLQLGGNLKMGVYEFLIAYCNNNGQEISEYYSITNPVSIFDQNNKIIHSNKVADRTNYSINLSISGLDTKYSYFKIAVIQTADIEGATSVFEVGVYPTTTTTVQYHSELDKKRLSFDQIYQKYMFVEETEGVATANNILYQYGVTNKKELNLQPAINLLGEVGVKWQTHIASEKFYEDGIATSKFLGYNREEVEPIGIKFFTNDGYETSVFNLVNRNSNATDEETVNISNRDRASLESTNSCTPGSRDKRWKIYDTATVDEDYCGGNIETREVEETVERFCTVERVAEIPAGSAIIPIDTTYTGLEDYINGNIGSVQAECETAYITPTINICSYLYADYSNVVCPPVKIEVSALVTTPSSGTVVLTIGTVNYNLVFATDISTTINNFVTANAANILTTTGATITASPKTINFYNATPNIVIVSSTGDIICGIVKLFENNCSDVTITDSTILVADIKGEKKEDIESIFPTEYNRMSVPKIMCAPYKTATSELSNTFQLEYEQDLDPPFGWGCGTFSAIPFLTYIRDSNFINRDCTYANDITFNQNTGNNIAEPFFFNYDYNSVTLSPLLTNKTSVASSYTNYEFYGFVSRQALWFKGLTENRNRFIIDISKQRNPNSTDLVSKSDIVRLTLFKNCSDTTHLYSSVINVSTGGIFLFEKIVTPTTIDLKITDGNGTVTTITNGWFTSRKYLIALDCPISYHTSVITIGNAGTLDCSNLLPAFPRYINYTIPGCITISKRDIEYSKARISWESIRIDKELHYTASCIFNQPIVKDCTAVPYKKGNFAFWESSEIYPDNNELYNSSTLKIKPSDIPSSLRTEFTQKLTNGVNPQGEFIWKQKDGKAITDLTCRHIRHFKFPSNKIAPFIWDNKQSSFSSTSIFPLGITVNEEYINALLDIAYNNNLISKKERESIVGYELVRGDLTLDRSVIASGLMFDMRKYTDIDSKEFYYPNYPYNSFCDDKLNNIPRQSNFGSEGSVYTFHSPETDYYSMSIPTEFSVQGYMFGNSKGRFNEVRGHSKYVILTEKARVLASQLAILELSAEAAIQSAMALSNAQVWAVAGAGSSGTSVGAPAYAASAIITAFSVVSSAVFKYGRYRYQWLQTFQNLGNPKNFAYYYYSEGYYNYMSLLQQEEDMYRGLTLNTYIGDGMPTRYDQKRGVLYNVNNKYREKSVMLSTGDYPIKYNSIYTNYDNNNYTASLTYSGESGAKEVGASREIKKNIASMYGYLKNYRPDLHGTIDSIKWITTGYRGDLKNPKTYCLPIFGGDTFIAMHDLKRKHAQFTENATTLPDRAPWNYYFYNNIGRNPRFYLSYGINKDFEGGGKNFPDVQDDFNLDLVKKEGNYYVEPSRFYLYYYGIPKFLCETRINTNFRYGGEKLEERSPSTAGDIAEWTQERNVSIREKNWFFYNKAYSKGVTPFKNRILSSTYTKAFNDCKTDFPNGIISSLPDNSENNDYDPWLIYRPLDFFEFPSNYGKLKDVHGIENEAIITRFENTSILWNKVDYTNDDGQNPTKPFLGGTSVFQRRSASFYNAQLGFGGTQNTTSISCEFGHFHVDAMRGQVIQTQPGGGQMEEISAIINGKPSGMRNWFKEQLPFKIKKYFKDFDVDNNYNGVGISMGWDSRYRRVFITKKDYIPKTELVYSNGSFYSGKTKVEFTNVDHFEDVSWTIAFSPILGTWISFYDFKPNYYVNHNNYFQTGINSSDSKNGLWSHLLTNRSYNVFYGTKYPFEIELPVKTDLVNKKLESITLWTEAVRYENNHDFNINNTLTFDTSIIWNNVVCSGQLNLIPQKNNFINFSSYPKTNTNNTQDILITNRDNFQWSYNYFYDRVKTTPYIVHDKNNIEKTVNSSAIAFKGINPLKRLQGDWFLNKLSYSKDSRFKLIFKFAIMNSEV